MNNLKSRINRLERVFDLEKILQIRPDKRYIQNYYKINKLPYSIFHSKENLIHMGVSKGSEFNPNDLCYFTQQISEYIEKRKLKNILELGSGRGANSSYLAKKFSDVKFVGIDFSQAQLDFAKDYSTKVDNLKFQKGDYHDLKDFEDESIDLCFVIEALCYSNNPKAVFNEVRRVLKPNGLFYIADGYLKKDRDKMSKEDEIVKRLIEVGMAVDNIKQYDEQDKIATDSGFKQLAEEDVSMNIIPTVQRFERLAKIYLRLGVFAKVLNKLLPQQFILNLLSGYLLKDAINSGLASYMITVYSKK